MLKQPQPGAWRRRTGILVLGAVLAGSSYTAWAVRPAAAPEVPPQPAVPRPSEAPPIPPVPTAPPAPPAPPDMQRPPPPPPAPPAPAAGTSPLAPAPPAPPAMAPPRYPAEAAASGRGGRVVLRLLVATDGRVKDVVVEHSEPAGVFDAASIEAARTWVLQPAQEAGQAVEGWVRVPIDFEAPGALSQPAGEGT